MDEVVSGVDGWNAQGMRLTRMRLAFFFIASSGQKSSVVKIMLQIP